MFHLFSFVSGNSFGWSFSSDFAACSNLISCSFDWWSWLSAEDSIVVSNIFCWSWSWSSTILASFFLCWSIGLWVTGSRPRSFSLFLIRVFQWFLISLSVRPGKWAAILDHLQNFISICHYLLFENRWRHILFIWYVLTCYLDVNVVEWFDSLPLL